VRPKIASGLIPLDDSIERRVSKNGRSYVSYRIGNDHGDVDRASRSGNDDPSNERWVAMGAEAAIKQHPKELDKRTTWDTFLETKTDTGFRQSSWYTTLKVARGWEHFGTVLRDGDTIVGGAMVLAVLRSG
jgi:hypothetical protein